MSDDTENHVDVLSAELVTHRNRQHIANHTRSIQEQTLDALLRIEELLKSREDIHPSIFMAKEDLIKDVAPVTTPFLETIKPTAGSKQRKNPRSL